MALMKMPVGRNDKCFHYEVGSKKMRGYLMVNGIGSLYIRFDGRPEPVWIFGCKNRHILTRMLLQLDSDRYKLSLPVYIEKAHGTGHVAILHADVFKPDMVEQIQFFRVRRA